jgi:hypothetical protein
MLIERSKYSVNDVISFKLVNGDEIVGRLVKQDGESYEINKPCVVLTTPEGIGVLQAMFGLDPDRDNLHYRDQHIVSMCPTHDKLKEHYIGVLEQGESTESLIQTTNIGSA